jgi:hypothetical protein
MPVRRGLASALFWVGAISVWLGFVRRHQRGCWPSPNGRLDGPGFCVIERQVQQLVGQPEDLARRSAVLREHARDLHGELAQLRVGLLTWYFRHALPTSVAVRGCKLSSGGLKESYEM